MGFFFSSFLPCSVSNVYTAMSQQKSELFSLSGIPTMERCTSTSTRVVEVRVKIPLRGLVR